MASYASNTDVSQEKSVEEIKRNLRRFGADSFSSFESSRHNMAGLEFEMNNRRVRFVITIPDRKQFEKTDTGRDRSDNQITLEWERSIKQKWRSLALIVKAKLVAVDEDVVEFDQEFAMHFVTANGQTMYEQLKPRMEEYCNSSEFPALMPGK
jgi:hypothetical protein